MSKVINKELLCYSRVRTVDFLIGNFEGKN